MRDERQDDAIDQMITAAAQALTAGEPTGALRAVVRERIAQRRPLWSSVPAWGLAAAAVILAVVVGRGLIQPAQDNQPPAPPARAVVEPVPPAVQPAAVEAPAPALAQDSQPVRRVVAAVAPPIEEEEPLIPPITIEPLSTTQIAVDTGSGVTPIDIEPLQIEPLAGAGQ